MELKPGTRLRSQVDDTEVIVVRSPSGEASSDGTLTCGGRPMIGIDEERAILPPLASGDESGGTLLGKRYVHADSDDLEVLVTHAGTAGLAFGGVPLVVKAARPLPSSD